MRSDPILLRQEVTELTELLRHDKNWSGLRQALKSKGLTLARILLAGFMEDEKHHEFGAIVTDELHVFEYQRNTLARSKGFTKWQVVTDTNELANDFPAVPIAVEMARGLQN